jgi:hypothetical protein
VQVLWGLWQAQTSLAFLNFELFWRYKKKKGTAAILITIFPIKLK